MDIKEVLDAMRSLEREKSIPFESLLEGLQHALAAAYRKKMPADRGARVQVDPLSGEIRVFEHELDEEGNPVLDEMGRIASERPTGPRPFGRIEAQAAKQVILQKIREAEQDINYENIKQQEGDIVTGVVQQSDSRHTILNLGNVEALMPQAEQVPNERYEHNSRVKAYVVEVRRNPRGTGPSVIVSRTHPGLIRGLFDLEVPEIHDKTVEIKAIAREPGHRTKIAVSSNEPGVDPVGACVGAKGSRVRMVVTELRGEKLDIIPFSEDAAEFVGNALSPAKVSEVRINQRDKTALVVVPDYQLSLAIGKEGQNARLAARLTGWRVDIKSESQYQQDQARKAGTEEQVAEAPPAEQPPAPAASEEQPPRQPSEEPAAQTADGESERAAAGAEATTGSDEAASAEAGTGGQ